MFKRFKEDDEKFKRYLINDFKGMLSFYEVLYFGIITDYILDEVLSFILSYLEIIVIGYLVSLGYILRFI